MGLKIQGIQFKVNKSELTDGDIASAQANYDVCMKKLKKKLGKENEDYFKTFKNELEILVDEFCLDDPG